MNMSRKLFRRPSNDFDSSASEQPPSSDSDSDQPNFLQPPNQRIIPLHTPEHKRRPPRITAFYIFPPDGSDPITIPVTTPAYTVRRRQRQARQIEQPPPPPPPPMQPPPPKPKSKRKLLPQDPIETKSGITAFYYFKDGEEPERKDVGPPVYTVRRRNRALQEYMKNQPQDDTHTSHPSIPPLYRIENLMN